MKERSRLDEREQGQIKIKKEKVRRKKEKSVSKRRNRNSCYACKEQITNTQRKKNCSIFIHKRESGLVQTRVLAQKMQRKHLAELPSQGDDQNDPLFFAAYDTLTAAGQEVTTADQRSHVTVTFLPVGSPKLAPKCIMGEGQRFVLPARCVCACLRVFYVYGLVIWLQRTFHLQNSLS